MGKRACHGEVLLRANSEILSEESLERKFTITHGNVKSLFLLSYISLIFCKTRPACGTVDDNVNFDDECCVLY